MTMSRPPRIDTLPRVAFVATGGTIAGTSTGGESSRALRYEAAQRSGESLVMAIPGLLLRAQWHFEEPYSIGSQNLELKHMLQLRAVLIRLLRSSEVDGIIVTHGTDTMEDMLYFLYLTLPVDCLQKPLLFTGSMLPSDHADADGPSNITGALVFLTHVLETAISQLPFPFGLIMQGLYTPAHAVEKQSTAGLDAFDNPCSVPADTNWLFGSEAMLECNNVNQQGAFANLFNEHTSAHPLFEAMEVPVVFCTPGNAPLHQLNDLLQRKPASIVLAAPGHGNIPDSCVPVLRRLLLNGVSVVRASRISSGGVEQGGEFNALDGFRENAENPNATNQLLINRGSFVDSGNLNLAKCVIHERLRVLARSLSV